MVLFKTFQLKSFKNFASMIVALLTDWLFSKIVVEALFSRQPSFLKLVEAIKILVGEMAFLQQEVEPFFRDACLRPDVLKITINMRVCLL